MEIFTKILMLVVVFYSEQVLSSMHGILFWILQELSKY